MKWSWTMGRVRGIELRVHATFVLLLAWLALVYYQQSHSAAGAVTGVVFTLALFVCVVLHELGHALVGRRLGVPTRDITLLPIGGVAHMERMPEEPRQELWIALAGPLVTLAIAVVLFVLLWVAGVRRFVPQETLGAGLVPFFAELTWINVMLLVFNLLPAFPMDGGRVLRALLAMRMSYPRATDVAARMGRAFALLFGIIGVFYNPLLVLIALFVWLGAAAESSDMHFRSSLAGIDVAAAMIHDLRTLAPSDTLDTAMQHVLSGFQDDFPVVENGRVVGMLTRAALLGGLARHGQGAAVADVMERSFRTAEPHEPLERAVARLRECKCQSMPVVQGGQLAGVLTLDKIGEIVAIAAALHATPRLARNA